jgi:hypothetical protein
MKRVAIAWMMMNLPPSASWNKLQMWNDDVSLIDHMEQQTHEEQLVMDALEVIREDGLFEQTPPPDYCEEVAVEALEPSFDQEDLALAEAVSIYSAMYDDFR